MERGLVFVCETQPHLRGALEQLLSTRGHEVEPFDAGAELLKALHERREGQPDLVLLEVEGPGQDGLETLRRIKTEWPERPVILTSGFATVPVAVAALKLGAQDFLVQPIDVDALLGHLEQVVERRRLETENRSLKDEIRRRFDPGRVVFQSPAFSRVFEMARRVADSEASVLIQGESGTGKELIASTIHYSSTRREQRFLTLNCAALTETLLESQLFGHMKGAFTGAVTSQRGLVEEADGGTLFLDEIGDVSPGLQAKLLRVLQEKEFLPVGATRARRADVRFVAATNKDLDREVASGRFREDLFYRLSVVTLFVPPLRERPEDVLPLAEYFLSQCGMQGQTFTSEVQERLASYDWPGNVRELQNVVEMATILAGGADIGVEYLPNKLAERKKDLGFTPPESPVSLADVEARYIEQVLRQTGYHKVNTAKILNISRSTLDRKIAQYAIGREEAGAETTGR